MVLDKNDLKAIGDLMDKKIGNFAVKVEKNINTKIDDLATVIGNSFNKLTTEINERFEATDQKIEAVRSELKSEIRSESSSIRADINRMQIDINDIKERLDRIEKRTLDDDDALSGDIITLKKRVAVLEKELKQLKLQKA